MISRIILLKPYLPDAIAASAVGSPVAFLSPEQLGTYFSALLTAGGAFIVFWVTKVATPLADARKARLAAESAERQATAKSDAETRLIAAQADADERRIKAQADADIAKIEAERRATALSAEKAAQIDQTSAMAAENRAELVANKAELERAKAEVQTMQAERVAEKSRREAERELSNGNTLRLQSTIDTQNSKIDELEAKIALLTGDKQPSGGR